MASTFLTVAGGCAAWRPRMSTRRTSPRPLRQRTDGEAQGALVFKLDSGFSISTNPNFRFTLGRGADSERDVGITDTNGTAFACQS